MTTTMSSSPATEYAALTPSRSAMSLASPAIRAGSAVMSTIAWTTRRESTPMLTATPGGLPTELASPGVLYVLGHPRKAFPALRSKISHRPAESHCRSGDGIPLRSPVLGGAKPAGRVLFCARGRLLARSTRRGVRLSDGPEGVVFATHSAHLWSRRQSRHDGFLRSVIAHLTAVRRQ